MTKKRIMQVEDGAVRRCGQVGGAMMKHLVQDEALPGIEANADVPLLPLDQVALHFKAGPQRLGDVKRLDVPPEGLLDKLGMVVDRLHWHLDGRICVAASPDRTW